MIVNNISDFFFAGSTFHFYVLWEMNSLLSFLLLCYLGIHALERTWGMQQKSKKKASLVNQRLVQLRETRQLELLRMFLSSVHVHQTLRKPAALNPKFCCRPKQNPLFLFFEFFSENYRNSWFSFKLDSAPKMRDSVLLNCWDGFFVTQSFSTGYS